MKCKLFLLLGFAAATAMAQPPVTIDLWPEGAPNDNGLDGTEAHAEQGRVGNVTSPEMYFYRAQGSNTRAAVLICPGGGYSRLAMDHEGHDLARWLSDNGISAAVLKYRMPNGHHEVPLSDAKRAMELLREGAVSFGIDPDKIGVAGSSAGGHLASTLGTKFDPENRPDFMILFYPVITFDAEKTHAGSVGKLLGDNPSGELRRAYSSELHVTADTPPTILFHSDDDGAVPPMNSVLFYLGLKKEKVPASLYIFPKGGHGWGFRSSFDYHETWKKLLTDWLRDRGITQ